MICELRLAAARMRPPTDRRNQIGGCMARQLLVRNCRRACPPGRVRSAGRRGAGSSRRSGRFELAALPFRLHFQSQSEPLKAAASSATADAAFVRLKFTCQMSKVLSI